MSFFPSSFHNLTSVIESEWMFREEYGSDESHAVPGEGSRNPGNDDGPLKRDDEGRFVYNKYFVYRGIIPLKSDLSHAFVFQEKIS